MNYRLVHNNQEVITISEATGITCSNGNEIVDGTLEEIYQLIADLNLTNTTPMSAFELQN
jgi:hypothetical protein